MRSDDDDVLEQHLHPARTPDAADVARAQTQILHRHRRRQTARWAGFGLAVVLVGGVLAAGAWSGSDGEVVVAQQGTTTTVELHSGGMAGGCGQVPDDAGLVDLRLRPTAKVTAPAPSRREGPVRVPIAVTNEGGGTITLQYGQTVRLVLLDERGAIVSDSSPSAAIATIDEVRPGETVEVPGSPPIRRCGSSENELLPPGRYTAVPVLRVRDTKDTEPAHQYLVAGDPVAITYE